MTTRSKITLATLALLFGSVVTNAAPATENWDNLCAKCHGADGKGATKLGKKLKLKDYTDATVQAAMTDEEITKAIADGVKDTTGKEKMKGFAEELSAQEVKDLAAQVRKFKS